MFLPFWLTMWTFGGLMAIASLVSGNGFPFLALWLVGWAAGWCMAFWWWWWMLTGRELVTFDGIHVTRTWRAKGFERSVRTPMSGLRDLRFSPPVSGMTNQDWRQLFAQMGIGGGSIAFADERGEPHRFGAGLSEDEARYVIHEIRDRYRIAD